MNVQNTIIRFSIIVLIAILAIGLNVIYENSGYFYIKNAHAGANQEGYYPLSMITFLMIIFSTYLLFLFVSLFNKMAHFLDAAILMLFNILSFLVLNAMDVFWKLILSELYQALIGGPPIGEYSALKTKYVWSTDAVTAQGHLLYNAFFFIFLISLLWSIYYFIQGFRVYQKKMLNA